MAKSLIVLHDLQFVEGQALEPAAVNAIPVELRPINLPAEPSSLALALSGIGILSFYAVVTRWRPQRASARKAVGVSSPEKSAPTEQPRRGAAA